MIKFYLYIFFFIFSFNYYYCKKLELIGSTRNSVIVKVGRSVFTFNFGDDFHIPGNVTVYEDDKFEVRNNARKNVYVDRKDYSLKLKSKNEKNETIYSGIVPNIMDLRSTIIYVLVVLIIILIVTICFFSYHFSNARKVLERLRKTNLKEKNISNTNSSTCQYSVTSSSLVSGSLKDKCIPKSTQMENESTLKDEKIVKVLVISKTGEFMIKSNKVKSFKNTEITPKTLSTFSNSLGFIAMLKLNDKEFFDENQNKSN
uniref:Transmembrane protein n=1 Tax=Strongyloides venezuelensis TaxID=75913 RepID=A0A0K0FVR6_STRVS